MFKSATGCQCSRLVEYSGQKTQQATEERERPDLNEKFHFERRMYIPLEASHVL
ncbi:hypothetical protein K443DRAFT_678915 [Laccaria amethystina LaAM-08-1]|uniref:Uncharacterized protein n=1 Tax=Laccaria amethystina LaAM-08-1 TaxID=1095629 RepID=A0A0C9XGU2_9AGAR|nr:hypothetical protein K443DRAFT_678915 [Laccaria amethystina LaAM-08-1]